MGGMERTLDQWLDYQLRTHPQQIAMGLERVREVAIRMRLGRAGRHIVTVAGTNGKGSTVAFIEAIARGDEILQMNGSRMAEWLKRTERHVSAETPHMAHSLMEYDFPMYLWVESGQPRAFNLLLRSGTQNA